MSGIKAFVALLVAAIALLGSMGPSAAQVDCGPHSRLGSVEHLAGGHTSYHCVCDKGYVPSSTAKVYGPKGVVLRPPRCVRAGGGGRTQQATRPSQVPRRGSYRAEPAHEPPPQRESAPGEQGRKAELGATAPAQPPVPPRPELSVPKPTAGAWSDKFPSMNAPAAVKLTQAGLSRIRDVPLPSPQWLREQAREAAKEKAFEFAWEQMPLGETVNSLRSMRKRMTELSESRVKETKEYIVHVFDLAADTVRCVGSADASTRCTQHLSSERVLEKYARTESGRKDDWLKEEFGKAYDVLRGEDE